MKKMLALISAILLVLSLASCTGQQNTKTPSIAIVATSKAADIEFLRSSFIAAGYAVDLRYDATAEGQNAALTEMVSQSPSFLIINPADTAYSYSAIDQQDKLTIISYGELINSPAVDYFVTFDHYTDGISQGEYLIEKLRLDTAPGSYAIEIVCGDQNDTAQAEMLNGCMSVLSPYFSRSKLKITSGQIEPERYCTPNNDVSIAQERLMNILMAYYSNDPLSAIVTFDDTLAVASAEVLTMMAYGENKQMPYLTGAGAQLGSIKSIVDNVQSQTLYRNPKSLAIKTQELVEAVAAQSELIPDFSNKYMIGENAVPTFVARPTVVDKTNYKDLLIYTGIYKESEIS